MLRSSASTDRNLSASSFDVNAVSASPAGIVNGMRSVPSQSDPGTDSLSRRVDRGREAAKRLVVLISRFNCLDIFLDCEGFSSLARARSYCRGRMVAFLAQPPAKGRLCFISVNLNKELDARYVSNICAGISVCKPAVATPGVRQFEFVVSG